MIFVYDVVTLVPNCYEQDEQGKVVPEVAEEIVKDELYCFHRCSSIG